MWYHSLFVPYFQNSSAGVVVSFMGIPADICVLLLHIAAVLLFVLLLSSIPLLRQVGLFQALSHEAHGSSPRVKDLAR